MRAIGFALIVGWILLLCAVGKCAIAVASVRWP